MLLGIDVTSCIPFLEFSEIADGFDRFLKNSVKFQNKYIIFYNYEENSREGFAKNGILDIYYELQGKREQG